MSTEGLSADLSSKHGTATGNTTKDAWQSLVPGVALIVFVTFVVYLPALQNGFVFDDAVITDHPIIRAKDGLYRIWFTTGAPDYYPLAWSSLWLQWRLWVANPTGYHIVNVALHVANAVLVWLVLRRFKIPGAWLAALLFAIHPVNAATVAWIFEQKTTLSMLFYLVAVFLYLKFDGCDGADDAGVVLRCCAAWTRSTASLPTTMDAQQRVPTTATDAMLRCGFRTKVATRFGPRFPPVSEQSCQRFRFDGCHFFG